MCIRWPGSVHNTHVFVNSALYNKVTNGDLRISRSEINGEGWNHPSFPHRGFSISFAIPILIIIVTAT